MTTKIHADTGIEFPDSTVQGSAAYSKAESDGPAFSARSETTQSVSGTTKVNLTGEIFDTHGAYNPSLSRFTPQVPGYYHFDCTIRYTTSSKTNVGMFLYKNGVIEVAMVESSTNTQTTSGSCIVQLNGTTDYVELWGSMSATTQEFNAGTSPAQRSFFSGFLARRA